MTQDFSGQNLRGRSFKAQNLVGADFSHADIRSVDFSKANLRGAKFVGAQAGLQRHWTIGLAVVSWLLSAVSGLFSGIGGYSLATFIIKDPDDVLVSAFQPL